MLPMRDGQTNEQGKIELLSLWMLDAEFRNKMTLRQSNLYHVFQSSQMFTASSEQGTLAESELFKCANKKNKLNFLPI